MTSGKVELATRLLGGVWGHLVGDAVGVPYEFGPARDRRRSCSAPPERMASRPGTWSDDGALMLALLDSLLEPGGFDPEDQGRRFIAWADDGALHARRGRPVRHRQRDERGASRV